MSRARGNRWRGAAVSTLAWAALAGPLDAQQPAAAPAAPRPGTPVPLAWRAEWKPAPRNPYQEPINQGLLATPNLRLHLYGSYLPEGLLFSHQFPEQVPHVFNGLCQITCALTFSDPESYVDLSGLGKVRLISYINGLHQLRLFIKLADGTYMMSDQTVGPSSDYRVSELVLRDIRWRKMNSERVVEDAAGVWYDKPDLSRVEEIGWTDMSPGVSHGQGGWMNVGWVEVYGKLVKREATSSR